MTRHGKSKFDRPRVTIFGGGITGLTVAHELIERGFKVRVIEKRVGAAPAKHPRGRHCPGPESPESPGETGSSTKGWHWEGPSKEDLMLGGLAATQYMRVPPAQYRGDDSDEGGRGSPVEGKRSGPHRARYKNGHHGTGRTPKTATGGREVVQESSTDKDLSMGRAESRESAAGTAEPHSQGDSWPIELSRADLAWEPKRVGKRVLSIGKWLLELDARRMEESDHWPVPELVVLPGRESKTRGKKHGKKIARQARQELERVRDAVAVTANARRASKSLSERVGHVWTLFVGALLKEQVRLGHNLLEMVLRCVADDVGCSGFLSQGYPQTDPEILEHIASLKLSEDPQDACTLLAASKLFDALFNGPGPLLWHLVQARFHTEDHVSYEQEALVLDRAMQGNTLKEAEGVLTEASSRPSFRVWVDHPSFDPAKSYESVFIGLRNAHETLVPGEHGFRFFPGFYRNLFDTMERIPVFSKLTGDDTHRSVLDNLIPLARLGFDDRNHQLLSLQRKAPTTLGEIRTLMQSVAASLHFTRSDQARFGLRMLQYLTTSSKRRAGELEGVSWWEYIEGDSFSPHAKEMLLATPHAMVAMSVHSDARMFGALMIQFFVDYFADGRRTDLVLNDPTTEAWFSHWREFLQRQGVDFYQGELLHFAESAATVMPVVRNVRRETKLLSQGDWGDESDCSCDGQPSSHQSHDSFYLLATDVATAKRCVEPLNARTDSAIGVLQRYCLNSNDRLPAASDPMRVMTGVQFYFRRRLNLFEGHLYFTDSPWGLTSISQPQFWRRYRNRKRYAAPNAEYRTVLSVDIGRFDAVGFNGKTAWECSADEIALEVWDQIRESLDYGEDIPDFDRYHIDDYVDFSRFDRFSYKVVQDVNVRAQESTSVERETPGGDGMPPSTSRIARGTVDDLEERESDVADVTIEFSASPKLDFPDDGEPKLRAEMEDGKVTIEVDRKDEGMTIAGHGPLGGTYRSAMADGAFPPSVEVPEQDDSATILVFTHHAGARDRSDQSPYFKAHIVSALGGQHDDAASDPNAATRDLDVYPVGHSWEKVPLEKPDGDSEQSGADSSGNGNAGTPVATGNQSDESGGESEQPRNAALAAALLRYLREYGGESEQTRNARLAAALLNHLRGSPNARRFLLEIADRVEIETEPKFGILEGTWRGWRYREKAKTERDRWSLLAFLRLPWATGEQTQVLVLRLERVWPPGETSLSDRVQVCRVASYPTSRRPDLWPEKGWDNGNDDHVVAVAEKVAGVARFEIKWRPIEEHRDVYTGEGQGLEVYLPETSTVVDACVDKRPSRGVLEHKWDFFVYRPDDGFVGVDSFELCVHRAGGGTERIAFRVHVRDSARPSAKSRKVTIRRADLRAGAAGIPIKLAGGPLIAGGNFGSVAPSKARWVITEQPKRGYLKGTPPNLIYVPDMGVDQERLLEVRRRICGNPHDTNIYHPSLLNKVAKVEPMYQVNPIGDYDKRPGVLPERTDELPDPHHSPPIGSPQHEHNFYKNLVLAGTYMKTYMRLTSMEAANESARHAVNVILEELRQRRQGRRIAEDCEIWDIEKNVFDRASMFVPVDIELAQKFDEILFEAGLPHVLEYLRVYDNLGKVGLRDVGTFLRSLERLPLDRGLLKQRLGGLGLGGTPELRTVFERIFGLLRDWLGKSEAS